MGSDDLFHKRRQRNSESLRRIENIRSSAETALIVCEDSKLTPNYLIGLREDLQLHPQNIDICNSKRGNDPLSVVKYAEEKYSRNKYDKVFCVVDKDAHPGYAMAIQNCRILFSRGIPIQAITSVPCFEYFLLLHYVDTTQIHILIDYLRKLKTT